MALKQLLFSSQRENERLRHDLHIKTTHIASLERWLEKEIANVTLLRGIIDGSADRSALAYEAEVRRQSKTAKGTLLKKAAKKKKSR